MYRRPKFLEILLEIRQEMAHEVDYDVDLFVEKARAGEHPTSRSARGPSSETPSLNGSKGARRRTPVAK